MLVIYLCCVSGSVSDILFEASYLIIVFVFLQPKFIPEFIQ